MYRISRNAPTNYPDATKKIYTWIIVEINQTIHSSSNSLGLYQSHKTLAVKTL